VFERKFEESGLGLTGVREIYSARAITTEEAVVGGGGPADVADSTGVGSGALPEEPEVRAGVKLHGVVRIGGRDPVTGGGRRELKDIA
jgi:hypothetical protein